MNTNEQEIKLLDIQLITLLIYVGSLIISIALTYNQKEILMKNNGILTDEQAQNLAIFNRILILCLTLIFLYTSFKNKNLAEQKQENIEGFDLQIIASELSTLATIIVLYVTLESAGLKYAITPTINNPNL